MTPETIITHITENFAGIVPKASWGETSLFYNPNNALQMACIFVPSKKKMVIMTKPLI